MYDVHEVIASGLSVARQRVNALASNIANAQTTQTESGGPYKRKDVVQIARDVPSKFSNVLDQMTLAKPQVQSIVEDQSEPKLIYQPGHPDANTDGYVAYPNINMVTTMTDLMTASRLYQANVTALKAANEMARTAARILIRF